jgi:Bromodomain
VSGHSNFLTGTFPPLSPESPAFNEPVDWRELGLLNYLEVCDWNPMDLATVQHRLETGYYFGSATNTQLTPQSAFCADVRTCFQNSIAYNTPGSDYHRMATVMMGKFNVLWGLANTPDWYGPGTKISSIEKTLISCWLQPSSYPTTSQPLPEEGDTETEGEGTEVDVRDLDDATLSKLWLFLQSS